MGWFLTLFDYLPNKIVDRLTSCIPASFLVHLVASNQLGWDFFTEIFTGYLGDFSQPTPIYHPVADSEEGEDFNNSWREKLFFSEVFYLYLKKCIKEENHEILSLIEGFNWAIENLSCREFYLLEILEGLLREIGVATFLRYSSLFSEKINREILEVQTLNEQELMQLKTALRPQ